MSQQNVEQMIIKLQADLSEFREQMGKAGDSTKPVGEQGKKSFGLIEKASAAAKVSILAVSAAAATVGVAMLKSSLETDKALGKLQAMTGASEEAVRGTNSLGSVAIDVFKNGWGESLDEVAMNMGQLKNSLGEVEDDTLKYYQIMQKTFEGVSIENTSRALRAMQANFPGLDQAKGMDLITRVIQETGNEAGEVMDTFNEYSTVISSMGMSAEDFGNRLVAASKAGARNVDMVADAMKEFNIRAKDGSEGVAKGYELMGLNAAEMTKKVAKGGKEGAKAMDEVIAALEKMEDPVKRNEAGVALFGTKFEDLEWNAIKAMGTTTNHLGKIEGATEKAGDAIQNNLGDKWTRFYRTLTTSLKENPLVEFFKKAIDAGTGFIQLFQSGESDILEKMFGKKKVQAILTEVNKIKQFIDDFKQQLKDLYNNFIQSDTFKTIQDSIQFMVSKAIEIIPQVIGVLKGVVDYLIGVFKPVFDDIFPFVASLFSKLKEFWEKDGGQMLEAVQYIIGAIGAIFDYIFPHIQTVVESVWGVIKNVVTTTLDILLSTFKIFSGMFTGDWDKMGEGLKGIVDAALNFIVDLFKLEFIVDMIKNTQDFLKDLLKKFTDGFNSVLKKVGEIVGTIVKTVVDFFLGLLKKPFEWGANLIKFFIDGIKSLFTNLGKTTDDTTSSVTNKFIEFLKLPFTWGANLISGLIDGIVSMWGALTSKVDEIVNFVNKGMNKILGNEDAPKVGDSPTEIMMNYLKDGIAEGRPDMDKEIEETIALVERKWGTDAKNRWVEKLRLNGIAVKEQMNSNGKDAGNGFMNGLESKRSDALAKVTSWAGSIVSAFKKKLEIHSPSRLFKLFGVNTVEGYEEGIEKESKNAVGVMNSFADSVIAPVKDVHSTVKDLLSFGNMNLAVAGLDIPDIESAINSSLNTSFNHKEEKVIKVELSLHGGFEKLTDEVEAKVVEKIEQSIGGRV